MKIVLAPQEFKGSLTAHAAAEAMAAGVRRASPEAQLDGIPMADGGPGLVEALVAARRGELRSARVRDPIGRWIEAVYGLIDAGRTAVIEMAAASGISRLRPDELDPLHATTLGTGDLIRAALDAGAQEVIIGIGGSATTDGGAGMAQALGVRLLDAKGHGLATGGAALAQLARIDSSGLDPRLRELRILAACDVTNTLCGPEGAAAVYGPQKGATAAMVIELDRALRHFAEVVRRDLGTELLALPGAGAAGGLGAGLVAFLGAELQPGFPLVAHAARLSQRIHGADLVLTGEGRIDNQTPLGKTVAGVAGIAREQGVPVIALAGSLGPGHEHFLDLGLAAVFSIVPGPISLPEAEANAGRFVAERTESILRTLLVGRGLRLTSPVNEPYH
jgi:glycerate kinase